MIQNNFFIIKLLFIIIIVYKKYGFIFDIGIQNLTRSSSGCYLFNVWYLVILCVSFKRLIDI